MPEFCNAAKTSEIAQGKGKMVPLGGQVVAIFRCEDGFYATSNTCPHRGGPLAEGSLQGGVVSCPWHGYRFDVRTGASADGLPFSVKPFAVRVHGEDVQVAV